MRDGLRQAEEIIAAALGQGRACLTCSFQAEDVVVLDLLRKRAPRIPVLFLDTGYHFEAVLRYRDELAQAWGSMCETCGRRRAWQSRRLSSGCCTAATRRRAATGARWSR